MPSGEKAALVTLTLKDGESVELWEGGKGQSGVCRASYEVIDGFIRFTYITSPQECTDRPEDNLQWRQDDAGLHFQFAAGQEAPITELRALYESQPWREIADQ